MAARIGRPGPATALLVAASALAAAAGAAAGPAPPQGTVMLATTGERAELRKTIPVTRRKRAEPKVAMSLSPNRMPSLMEGDRLEVTAEVQTTNNCRRRTSFCVGPPYGYSPWIGAQLRLADRVGAAQGPRTMPISSRKQRRCMQAENNREHHCVLVFTAASLRLDEPADLPCELDECRVNLVVDAHHPDARRGDPVILGIDRSDGKIKQDRGRINVARFRGPAPDARSPKTGRRLRKEVNVEKGSKTSIYSLRLNDLEKGEQLTFDASAHTSIGHLPYATFIGSQLILARSPGSVRTTPFTRAVGSKKGEVTEGNGFNCTQRATPCTSRRVGTLTVQSTPRRRGEVVPLYVNFVLRNAPKRFDDRPGDHIKIDRGGGIEAKRYPASARG